MHFRELLTSSGEQVLGTTAAFSEETPTMPRRQEGNSTPKSAGRDYGDSP